MSAALCAMWGSRIKVLRRIQARVGPAFLLAHRIAESRMWALIHHRGR